ncbi:MAG: exosortase [Verrucomicrobiales bacterium]|jgi:exosortase
MNLPSIPADAFPDEQKSRRATPQLGREWRMKNWGAGAFIIALWTMVLGHLGNDWRFDPEYRFGWFVPVMMAIVLATRFGINRPTLTANRARLSPGTLSVFLGMLVAWPVIRIIGIANPDWHLFTWITTLSGIALTLIIFHSIGGKKMVYHYGVPFLLVAAVVPWPFILEQQLIATLKGTNAFLVTEALNLFSIAAIRESGGVISMPNAVLGIEEGCTGIRSLHLCLAVALFWGEWFRLSIKGRSTLVGTAFLVAILVNVVRTLSLAMIAHYSGAEALAKWHDQAGLIAQASVVAICWILTGWLIARNQRWSRARFKKSPKPEPAGKKTPDNSDGIRLKGIAFCLAALWVLCSEAGARYWFMIASDNAAIESPQRWQWSVPPNIEGIKQQNIPQQWMSLLVADDGFSGIWKDKEQSRVRYLYSFHWQEGRPAALFATHHRPEDCLPGSGFELIGSAKRVTFETSGGTSIRTQSLLVSIL